MLSFLSVAVIAQALLQCLAIEDKAVCRSSFSWMSNTQGQDPCQIASTLQTHCALDTTGSHFPPLNGLGEVYPPPKNPQPCECNTVYYSLVSGCAACQGRNWISFDKWTAGCAPGTVTNGSYSFAIPSATIIPPWTSVNVLRSETFDLVAAKALASLNPTRFPQVSRKAGSTLPVSLGVVLPVFAILALFVFLSAYIKRSRSRSHSHSSLLGGRSGYTLIDDPHNPRKHRSNKSSLSILIPPFISRDTQPKSRRRANGHVIDDGRDEDDLIHDNPTGIPTGMAQVQSPIMTESHPQSPASPHYNHSRNHSRSDSRSQPQSQHSPKDSLASATSAGANGGAGAAQAQLRRPRRTGRTHSRHYSASITNYNNPFEDGPPSPSPVSAGSKQLPPAYNGSMSAVEGRQQFVSVTGRSPYPRSSSLLQMQQQSGVTIPGEEYPSR